MKYKVLIMEDDRDLLSQWVLAFSGVGVEATSSTSRSEAEDRLNAERFDALVTDIFVESGGVVTSGEGGLLLIGHVRNPGLGFTPEWARKIPIVAVTATQASKVTHAQTSPTFDPLNFASGGGADSVMRKPFEPQELVTLVISMIESSTEASG